jgi:lipopolysaccharide/colanic/teichoic acid biosynthesis glycosyltransferase
MLPIRLVNITGSALALIVLSPLLVLVAVWLKLATSGPVFCVRERVRPKGGTSNFRA